ncbi:MAG TPA: hypothetical protein ENK12_11205 [Gammaproteobacteria bacterium]|nr:hypothetical protein [Gammaproteobacteria bacterium]
MSHNSWNGFAPALRIDWRPSRSLARLLYGAHALAAVLWLSLPLAWPYRAAGLGILLLALRRDRRRHVLGCHPAAVTAIEYRAGAGWRVRGGDGRWRCVPLYRPVFVTPWLVIAAFGERPWRLRRLVLCADAVEARRFRHLRVRLIHSAHGDRDRTQVPAA